MLLLCNSDLSCLVVSLAYERERLLVLASDSLGLFKLVHIHARSLVDLRLEARVECFWILESGLFFKHLFGCLNLHFLARHHLVAPLIYRRSLNCFLATWSGRLSRHGRAVTGVDINASSVNQLVECF